VQADVLVVGSGASAVNAAYPLVAAGLRVRMLDVGNRDEVYEPLVPTAPFSTIRRTDPNQHRYFLGDRFEGVALDRVSVGAQLTPPRQHVPRDTARLTPVVSRTFSPLESLALGGLAAAWGAGCPPFVDVDLAGFPITHADLAAHYEAVAERIGISGARDDLTPFFGDLHAMQPAVTSDTNARCILRRYERRRPALNRAGFHLGQPRLAMLSRDHRGRAANPYFDMDFWSDHGRSVYRPRWTVEEMLGRANFEYRPGLLVERFRESGDGLVEVAARDVTSGAREPHRARALVLAAGTLGTTRIALRSLDAHGVRVPLVCNPHTYAPMLNLHMLGKAGDDRRHSMAQLCFAYASAPGASATVGHLFSYRSLLGFKLLRESPLAYREGVRVIRLLLPSLAIVLMQHADAPGEGKHCVLRPGRDDRPDTLEIEYAPSGTEEERIERTERAIARCFRRLGCICLRRVRTDHAASAHYAGTLPMTAEQRALTTEPGGRLRGTRAVYVADGATFPRLPSKGLTFTMMANADRVGTHVRRDLGS